MTPSFKTKYIYAGVALLAALAYVFFVNALGAAGWPLFLSHPKCLVIDGLLCALALVTIGLFLLRMHLYGIPLYVQYILFIGSLLGVEYGGLSLLLTSEEQALPITPGLLPFCGRLFLGSLYSALFLLWKARFTSSLDDIPVPPPIPLPTTLSNAPEWVDRITVRAGAGIKVIPIAELLYIKAEGDYIALVTREGRWLKEQTMKSIQESLPPRQYVRIHRSFLVNVAAISRIERYGEQQLVSLHNGDTIRISATGYKALREALGI